MLNVQPFCLRELSFGELASWLLQQQYQLQLES